MNNDGSVWMSPDFTPLNLISKWQISGVAGAVFQSQIPAGNNFMFFVKFSSDGLATFSHIIQNGYHALRVDRVPVATGNITVYAFGDLCTNIPKYGIFMFNASGAMVYHAGMIPLELSQVGISISVPTVNVGYQCAVSPSFSGVTSSPDPQLGGYIIRTHYTGAFGQTITNRNYDFSRGSGPVVVAYQTTALFINTEKYDQF